MKELAELLLKNTHYLVSEIQKIGGGREINIKYDKKRIFNEFVLESPVPAEKIIETGLKHGVLMGINLGQFYDHREKEMLVAVTEKRTKQDFDRFIQILKDVLK